MQTTYNIWKETTRHTCKQRWVLTDRKVRVAITA